MDKKLMAQLGIRPILKRKSMSEDKAHDVVIYASKEHMTEHNNFLRNRISISIKGDTYERLFKGYFMSFGYAKEVKRLYLWESDNQEGFKMSHKPSKLGDHTPYIAQSTDMYEALKDVIKFNRKYYLDFKYSKEVGLYYIEFIGQQFEED